MRLSPSTIRKLKRDGLVVLAIGTFLAFINPYNAAGSAGFVWRWLYWTGLIFYGGVVSEGVSLVVKKVLPDTLPKWVLGLVISVAIAVFIFPVVMLIQFSMGFSTPVAFFPVVFLYVWVICVAVTAVSMLIDRNANLSEAQPDEQAGVSPTASFMERLEPKYRTATLYAVESEDHYLRVHTDRGEAMILMRLADAVRELSGAEGLQTHRSWWVARAGVETVHNDAGKLTIALLTGKSVPVSRANATSVRQAGWV